MLVIFPIEYEYPKYTENNIIFKKLILKERDSL